MINRTSARESVDGSLGTSFGFRVDLLDFLVAMRATDDIRFHKDELSTAKGEGRDTFSQKPL